MAAWILALTLAAQEVPDRLPELTGRVTAAVPDDPSLLLTIRPSGGTLKERPAEFLLYVTPETKVRYSEVPLAQQSPAANMVVQVWLKDGTGDKAAVVRLALEEKSFPRPPAPPPPPPPPPPPVAKPTPAPLPFPSKPAAGVTVEAEDMDLRGVEARELKDASRGRAIYFSQPGSRAKKQVDLKKGVYDVQVVMQGKKGAVVVKVAGRDHRATAELPRFSVEIEKDEDYELRIECAEADVWVDRVVFAPEVTIDAEGFLRRWVLLAPLPTDPRTALDAALVPNEAGLRPRAGEKTSVAGKDHVWRAWDSPDAVLDLNQALGRFAEDAAAYAVCKIKTDQEFRELELRMGSDDHAKVWLNGAELLRQPGPRVAVRDQSVARGVVLRKGDNFLVFKLVNEKAAWSGCVRFVQKDGRPVTAARIVP